MEQQVNSITPQESTQGTEQPVNQGIQVQAVEQPQGTETTPTEQPAGQESVDISKIDPSQLTPEQVAELQKGYMRQNDYTKKTQEISAQKPNFANIVQSPEFLQWAKDIGLVAQTVEGKQQQVTQEPEFMQSLNDEQKQAIAYYFQQLAQPYVQTVQNQTWETAIVKLQDKYGKDNINQDSINNMKRLYNEATFFDKQTNKKYPPLFYPEEVFKITDYDNAIKRAFDAGKQEGLRGVQQRQQANLPQSTTTVNSTRPRVYESNDDPKVKLQKAFEYAQKQHGQPQNAGNTPRR